MLSDSQLRVQIWEILKRFGELVSTRNMQLINEFTKGDDILLVGSEAGEVARGRNEIEAFFVRIFAREETFSWEWDRVNLAHSGDLAWFFAEGRVVISTAKEQKKTPYRISGVLERRAHRWLWKQYHGSEPVTHTSD